MSIKETFEIFLCALLLTALWKNLVILIVYTFNASAESSQPSGCVCQDLHTKFTPDTAEVIFAKSVDLKLGWTKDIKLKSFHLLSKTNIYCSTIMSF